MTVEWFYALTLIGDERHAFVPLPDRPDYMPPDAVSLCGKLLRYRLRGQSWTEHVPGCRLCAARLRPFEEHQARQARQARLAAQNDTEQRPSAGDTQISDLIRAGVPLDRIGQLEDGTWAYVAPCQNETEVS